jgi:hypothetical protein
LTGRTIPPLPTLRRTRKSNVDQNNVVTNFDDIFQFNEKIRPLGRESSLTGHDETENLVFWIAEYYIANLAQFPAIRRIDDFFRTKLGKTHFHTAISFFAKNERRYSQGLLLFIICGRNKKVPPSAKNRKR